MFSARQNAGLVPPIAESRCRFAAVGIIFRCSVELTERMADNSGVPISRYSRHSPGGTGFGESRGIDGEVPFRARCDGTDPRYGWTQLTVCQADGEAYFYACAQRDPSIVPVRIPRTAMRLRAYAYGSILTLAVYSDVYRDPASGLHDHSTPGTILRAHEHRRNR